MVILPFFTRSQKKAKILFGAKKPILVGPTGKWV